VVLLNFVCIVNPVSGKGRAIEVARRLRRRLEHDGHHCRVLQTSGDPETFEVICDAIEPDDRVICIGGDGTLLYLLNHCPECHSVAFYGMGTANVISIELEIPKDIDRFVDMLEDDHHRLVRPGLTDDGSLFLMMCSFGLDSYVLERVSQRGKNQIGKRAFIWPFLRSVFRYRYPVMEVSIDGGPPKRAKFGLISRIQHYGGPFRVAPDADPTGDDLVVLLYPRGGAWSTLKLIWYMVRNRIAECPGVSLTKGQRVVISAPGKSAPFQVDGDSHPSPVSTLSVSDRTFALVVPQPTPNPARKKTTPVETTG